MRIKTIIVLLLSVLPFSQMAAQNSDPVAPDKPGKVTRIYGGRAGVKIPTGYSFLEEEEAEAFANKIGDDGFNPNRIGYLVPEQDADEMISFPLIGFLDSFDVGHINYPESMETDAWKNMLMKLSDCKDESAFSFLWKPITFHDTHATSIGFSIDEKKENEMCVAVVYIPVKEGFWMWYIRFPKDYSEEAKDICALLADSISFDPSLNYENYEFKKRTKGTYEYYRDYYNDNQSYGAPDEIPDKANDKASPSKALKMAKASVSFLMVDKVGASILAVMGIMVLISLFFLVKIKLHSNKKRTDEDSERFLSRCVKNIKARLGLFASIYATYVFLSFSLIVALFYGTVFLISGIFGGWFIFAFILGIYTVPLDIIVVMFITGLWYGAITLFRTLLKPIMKSKEILKNSSDTSGYYLIPNNESPDLYKLISQTAMECGVDMPKKVYFSMLMNAAVSYDNPFKGMRDHNSDKTLMIGLPFVFILSEQELKAVIAHEFGHFAQKTTSQLTAVYYIRNMIYKILEFDESESKQYVKWLSHSNGTLRFMGRVSYWLISRICMHVCRLYGTVVRASNEMSREMEHDADRMSAKIAGNASAISTLYKTQSGDIVYNDFYSLLKICHEQHGMIPENIMGAFKMMIPVLQKRVNVKLDNSETTVSSSMNERENSRVEIINEWDTHPETEIRVEFIRNLKNTCGEIDNFPADILLTEQTVTNAEKEIVFNHLSKDIKVIPDEEFKRMCEIELDERTFPEHLAPFFNRKIHIRSNNWPKSGQTMTDDEWNAALETVKEFNQAICDYNVIIDFMNGNYGSKEIKYLGKKYNKKNVPVDEQGEYLKKLEKRIESIDMSMMAHAIACADSVESIKNKYLDISYCQRLIASLHQNFDSSFGWLRDFYMSPDYITTERAVTLSQTIRSIEQDFKFIEKEINFSILAPVIHKDLYDDALAFIKSPSEIRSLNDTSQSDIMFKLLHYLELACKDLIYFHSKNICAVIEGKKVERFWKNSLASVNENQMIES